jgi:hypothetical protein
VQFVNTINKNKAFFTYCQIEQAKQLREFYHALGTPSIQDFKAIIQSPLKTTRLHNRFLDWTLDCSKARLQERSCYQLSMITSNYQKNSSPNNRTLSFALMASRSMV